MSSNWVSGDKTQSVHNESGVHLKPDIDQSECDFRSGPQTDIADTKESKRVACPQNLPVTPSRMKVRQPCPHDPIIELRSLRYRTLPTSF